MDDKHPLMNSIGAIVGAIAIIAAGIWQFGQRDAMIGEQGRAIESNTAAISKIEKGQKEGFDKIEAALKELRESQTNEDIAVLKTKLEHIEEQLKNHDHNGTYSTKDHVHVEAIQ